MHAQSAVSCVSKSPVATSRAAPSLRNAAGLGTSQWRAAGAMQMAVPLAHMPSRSMKEPSRPARAASRGRLNPPFYVDDTEPVTRETKRAVHPRHQYDEATSVVNHRSERASSVARDPSEVLRTAHKPRLERPGDHASPPHFTSTYDDTYARPARPAALAPTTPHGLRPEDSASQCGDRDRAAAGGEWVPARFPIWAPSTAIEERRFRKGFRVSCAALRDGTAAAATATAAPLPADSAWAEEETVGDRSGRASRARASVRSRSFGRPPVDCEDVAVAPQRGEGWGHDGRARSRSAARDRPVAEPPQGRDRVIPSAVIARRRRSSARDGPTGASRGGPRGRAASAGVASSAGSDGGYFVRGAPTATVQHGARSGRNVYGKAAGRYGERGRSTPQVDGAAAAVGGWGADGRECAAEPPVERRAAYIEAAAFWGGGAEAAPAAGRGFDDDAANGGGDAYGYGDFGERERPSGIGRGGDVPYAYGRVDEVLETRSEVSQARSRVARPTAGVRRSGAAPSAAVRAPVMHTRVRRGSGGGGSSIGPRSAGRGGAVGGSSRLPVDPYAARPVSVGRRSVSVGRETSTRRTYEDAGAPRVRSRAADFGYGPEPCAYDMPADRRVGGVGAASVGGVSRSSAVDKRLEKVLLAVERDRRTALSMCG